jgi:hypothetical protein
MSVPTPQPIADWLEKLGLGQHAQRFAENEIDVSVLRHLTDRGTNSVSVKHGKWVLSLLPAKPRLAPPPVEHYFPTE